MYFIKRPSLSVYKLLSKLHFMKPWSKARKVLLILEFSVASLVFLFFSLYNPPFQQISDDRMILLQFLEKQAGQQVLGASSQTVPIGCPANKPVIGWIDYAGKKTNSLSVTPKRCSKRLF